MRAILCRRYGGPEVLELRELPRPHPASGEVLVKVHAAGLNAADWHIARADPALVRLSLGPRRPNIKGPGADLAGTVEALGEGANRLRPGDAVIGELSACGWGARADYGCVPETYLARKPDQVGFEEAAAVPLSGNTALRALRDKVRVQPGERALVHGASGGVGTYAVQIVKTFGAHVTGKLQTVIDRTYPLEEFAAAFAYLEEGHSHGKTVLTMAA